jgi:hypothetical protein
MKAAVKTYIEEWSVSEGKEKLVFPKLDFSPDQVGNLDRILRDGENMVTLTIKVVKKKLQIEPVDSQVHIISMNCMNGGQKLKISGFKSPDSRAVAMKSLADTKEPVMITIEDKQGKLPYNVDKSTDTKSGGQKEFEIDPEPNEHGVFEKPNVIEVKLPKSYGIKVSLSWVKYQNKFYIGHDILHTRFGGSKPVSLKGVPFSSLTIALGAFLSSESDVNRIINDALNYKYKKQVKSRITETIEKYCNGE